MINYRCDVVIEMNDESFLTTQGWKSLMEEFANGEPKSEVSFEKNREEFSSLFEKTIEEEIQVELKYKIPNNMSDPFELLEIKKK